MGSEESSHYCEMNCPTVNCPEPKIPDFQCPKLECPIINLPNFNCKDVILGDKHCPTITFPELKCPAITCPEVTFPKFECPAMNCSSMTLQCSQCLDYSIGLVIMVTILVSLTLILTFIYHMKTRNHQSESGQLVRRKVPNKWRWSRNRQTMIQD